MGLENYQQRVDWMGTSTLTLADLWPHHLRSMIVNRFPSPASVAAGVYYVDEEEQSVLRRFVDSGLLASLHDIEQQALNNASGFTHLYKRSDIEERPPTREEFDYARALLTDHLARRRVPAAVCADVEVLEALTGQREGNGWIEAETSWGGKVFHIDNDTDIQQLRTLMR